MSICKYVNQGGICILHSEENYEEPCHEGPCPDYKPIADLEDYCSRLWKIAYERGKAESRGKGEWIGKPIGGFATVRCSQCKEVYRENTGRWNFCPNCGADMRGKDDE